MAERDTRGGEFFGYCQGKSGMENISGGSE